MKRNDISAAVGCGYGNETYSIEEENISVQFVKSAADASCA